MSQPTLDTWLRASPKPPLSESAQKHRSPALTQTTYNAKATLEPLFIRPIPEHPRYTKQLQEEYELIEQNNFILVFLQVRTVLQLIEAIGEETGAPIPHIIRGSAGSSLVCYLLGITHIDPIKHGIQLARFMNKGRQDIPDIDIDVPYNRREEIYGRIAQTWPGAVARISNYNLWSHKTALRECVKEALRDSGEHKIPAAVKARGFNTAAAAKVLPDKAILEETTKKAKTREGTLRTYSKHCGGIVIFEQEGAVPEDLILKPIAAAGKPLVQLRLNKDDTEAAGFIKIDLLSNRGLAQLAQICPDRPLTQYPTRDGLTERIFEKGWNLGITFGESRGMRKLFMELRPQNVLEVAVALALIRPAAAAEGRKQEFLDKWKHPAFRGGDALDRPILFDDDAICKVRKLLGCDAADADKWRKAFAKGNSRARIDFRLRAAELGHSRDIVDSVVDDLNQLVYYSFCKSHAVSYAQLVWALAYWKAHRPHEFWAAALNHCHSEYRKWVHYREARCSGLGLSCGPPPYKVVNRQLISERGEQKLLAPLAPVQEFREFGYWCSEAFFPTCGRWTESQRRLDGKRKVRFRGLIATCRTIRREWGNCTLICLGIGNREFVDLVIPDKHRSDLFRWAVLEGCGVEAKEGTIEVESIRGVSLNACV